MYFNVLKNVVAQPMNTQENAFEHKTKKPGLIPPLPCWV